MKVLSGNVGHVVTPLFDPQPTAETPSFDERLTQVALCRVKSLATTNAGAPLVVAAIRDLKESAKCSESPDLNLYTTLYSEAKELLHEEDLAPDAMARVVRLVLGGEASTRVEKAIKKVTKRGTGKAPKPGPSMTGAQVGPYPGPGAPTYPWPAPFPPVWGRPPPYSGGPPPYEGNRKALKCYGCGELGHIRRVCPRSQSDR